MKFFATVLAFLASTAVGVLLLEVGYRGYIYLSDSARFQANTELPNFYGIYDRSLWVFHEEFGYTYDPERKVNQTSISDGRVSGCAIQDHINPNGNVGESGLKHDNPDHTIAVFGDSWTAFHVDGVTWPVFLQAEMERRTGKKVNVINYGRDGYGLIQMFRLANHKIPEVRPDLALIAFITDDLDRASFWRTEVTYDGVERVVTTTEPLATPPLEISADTIVLHEDATHEWCQANLGKRDSVVEEIEERYRNVLRHVNKGRGPPPNLFTLKHSYVFNRVAYQDPTYFAQRQFRPSQNPRLKTWSYKEVEGFAETVESLDGTGVPWRLVHLAFFPEVQSEQEYILSDQRRELLASLEEIAGHAPLETLAHVQTPVENPARMNVTETNYHPSLWGMEFYAEAVAEMIIRNGLLD